MSTNNGVHPSVNIAQHLLPANRTEQDENRAQSVALKNAGWGDFDLGTLNETVPLYQQDSRLAQEEKDTAYRTPQDNIFAGLQMIQSTDTGSAHHKNTRTGGQESVMSFGKPIVKVAENAYPPTVNKVDWPKVDLDQSNLVGLIKLAWDSVKNIGAKALNQVNNFAQKQVTETGKQFQKTVNTLDLNALLGAKPPELPKTELYTEAGQHAEVLLNGTARKETNPDQLRQLQETRVRINRMFQEGKKAKQVLKQDDRRLGEAQQALSDPTVAAQYRRSRGVTPEERKRLEDQEGEIGAILAIKNQRRQQDIASQPLPETGAAPAKGLFGKARKKAGSLLSNLGITSSRADRGEQRNQAGG